MSTNRILSRGLAVVLILSGLIWICTNFSLDEAYGIGLAYRLISGDRPIVEIWEPHQTSAFLTAFLMYVFRTITGSFDGVVVFLHTVGLIFRGLIAYFFYRTLKKENVKEGIALCAGALFFMISPKDSAVPEYANLQVWFGMLGFLFLVRFFGDQKRRDLLLAALALCLQIIAYPSCVILFPVMLILIWVYAPGESRVKAMGGFLLVCVGVGILFCTGLLLAAGPGDVGEAVRNMLLQEPSHTVSPFLKLLTYVKDLAVILGICGGVWAVSLVLALLVNRGAGRAGVLIETSLAFAFAGLLILFFINILTLGDRGFYGTLFLFMILSGLSLSRSLPDDTRRLYYTGTILSVAGFAATLMLTNLPLMASSAYLVTAVCLSLIPLENRARGSSSALFKRTGYVLLLTFFALLFFRAVYVRTPLTGRGQICSVLNTDLSLIRKGPAKGIITDEEGARKQTVSYEEFRELVPEGSILWIVDPLSDNMGYLYGEYEVSSPSIIPDPKFAPGFERYWELNPDKYPDVVAVAAYEGEISYDLRANPLIMEWVEEIYRPARFVDGTYWRFYYRK